MKDKPAPKPHKVSAAELELERAKADAIFLSIGEGAIATDEQAKIRRINQAALTLLGLTEEEAIGAWFPQLIVAEDGEGEPLKTIDRPIARVFLTGLPVTAKAFYRRKDKSVFPVAITVSPILLEDRPIGAIEVFRDITVESEIDRMKSEFISIASHQLRTPLTAIKTYSHMLAGGYGGELSTDQQHFLDIILASTDRMNELISTLLNISRIEAGRISVTPKAVSPPALVEAILQELRPRALEKQIQLKMRLNKAPKEIRTDELLTQEIFANLLSNAIKYTPSGGTVTITVTGRGSEIVFSIKDTGYGIPQSLQNLVFTKFFRASNITDKETAGTGLGLYMVKGIVDMLGGQIWFKSEEGKGSTFSFSIPQEGVSPKSVGLLLENSPY